ncbi:MAG: hypothetical protein ACYCSO_10075 [Cuniculiplasma sp.]
MVFETSKAIVKSTKERYFTKETVQNGNYNNSKDVLDQIPLKSNCNSNDNSLKSTEKWWSPKGELPELPYFAATERDKNDNPEINPVNSDVQSEFSQDMMDGIISILAQHGYHVDPESQISPDRKSYLTWVQIEGAIDCFEDFQVRLKTYSFTFSHFQGGHGYLFKISIPAASGIIDFLGLTCISAAEVWFGTAALT